MSTGNWSGAIIVSSADGIPYKHGDALGAATTMATTTGASRPRPPGDMPDTAALRQAVLVVYLACFFFGLMGNSLVLGIIGYYKEIRTKSVANYYIWSLSLADLLFILTLPFFCYTTFTADWPFGNAICKVSFAFRETNRFSSVFLLVALSWDRYMASFYSLGHLRTIRVGVTICGVVWLSCATLSTPYWIYSGTVTRMNRTMCLFEWPHTSAHGRMLYMRLWTYLQLCLGLLLPLFMISLAYVLLSLRLKRMLGMNQRGPGGASGVKKPSRKMTRTVTVVVSTFLLCQTPYYVMEVWALLQQQKVHDHRGRGEVFTPSRLELHVFVYLNSVAQMLVFISSSINPILYGLMNDNYRKLYRVVLCRCRKVSIVEEPGGAPQPGHTPGTAVPGEVTSLNSDSDGDDEVAAVASVTYKFKITFHHPCVKKRVRGKKQPPSTEQVLLEERTNNNGVASTAADL